MAFFALPPSGNAMPPSLLLRARDRDFAAAFAAHGGHREAGMLLTDSGTAALYLAFRGVAAIKGAGGRVAVPAWCCPSVPQAALQAGLIPVPVDLDPDTLAYAHASLAAAQAQAGGLAAVVLVHFFGMAAPRPESGCGGALFIRDCAQDFDYRPDPAYPCPCIYSFGRGKALNAGHGGALCLPAPSDAGHAAFAAACRAAWEGLPASSANPLLKALAINVLSHPRIYWAVTALPGLGIGATVWEGPLRFARISPAFARLGPACLDAWLQRRNGYRALIGRYHALASACDPARLRAPVSAAPYWFPAMATRFPLLIADAGLRAGLYHAAQERFGGVTRMYPTALSGLPGAPAGLLPPGLDAEAAWPGACRVAREILTLPVAAALLGREDAFLDFLEGFLAAEGVLRKARSGHGMDWSAVPDLARHPALFPGR